MSQLIKRLIHLCLCCLLVHSAVVAQSDSLQTSPSSDTLTEFQKLVKTIQELGKQEAQKSIDKFKTGRVAIRQQQILEQVSWIMQKAKNYLKRGLDTAGTIAELERIKKWYDIAADGVFTNTGTIQTYRNLRTSYDLLEVLSNDLKRRKKVIDNYKNDLFEFRDQIDSLSTDSSIYTFPADSAALTEYFQKLTLVTVEIGPTDSLIDKSSVSLNALSFSLGTRINMIASSMEDIETYERRLFSSVFNSELGNIFGPVGYTRPMKDIARFSAAKGQRVFWYYTSENSGKLIFLVLLIIVLSVFLRSLKNKIKTHELLRSDYVGQLVFRYPSLSATLIIISLFQFIFPAPPFIFSFALWIIASAALTLIFRGYISKYWMEVWLSMVILFVLAGIDNLLLQASRGERWIMLFLSLAGFIASLAIILKGHRFDLKEKRILYFIGLVILLEFISMIANISGRYNISKSLLVSGFLNVIIAILFLWTVRLLNQVLKVASKVYNAEGKSLSVINFEKIGESIPSYFYAFLALGWVILMGRNFYSFQLITQPISDFFFSERNLGDYTFTISNILIFFLIMILSVIISRIISFFASEGYTSQKAGKEKKLNIGSWILLIRIIIICLGLFLAFAAAGIPLDRITIIIGALGVGIGLGLQALVNNLVSGLIIAFEKPVNVGDIVDVAGISGRMKSIGFRSSVIATWDGADVVIPNGDILNAHLVNWTMGNSTRRTDLLVGVAYGTDLEKTKKLIQGIINADKRILKSPEPLIVFQEFGSSSIDIRVYYWISHAKFLIPTKSDLVSSIDKVFKENNIEIPFPQTDLHIRSITKENTEEADAGDKAKPTP